MGNLVGMDGRPIQSVTNLPTIELKQMNQFQVILHCPEDGEVMVPIAHGQGQGGVQLVKSKCPKCNRTVDLPVATGGIINSPEDIEMTTLKLGAQLGLDEYEASQEV